jgi:hypothetical protein
MSSGGYLWLICFFVFSVAVQADGQFDAINLQQTIKPGLPSVQLPTTMPWVPDEKRATFDKKFSFPVASEAKLKLKLPSPANGLEKLPEEISDRVFYLWAAGQPSESFRNELNDSQVAFEGFDWAARGKGDTKLVLFKLTNGRVSRLGYLLPNATMGKINKLIEPVWAIDPLGKPEKLKVVLTTGEDVRVLCKVSGRREEKIKGEYHAGTVGGEKGYRDPSKTYIHPTFVSFEVNGADWIRAYESPDEKTLSAIDSKKIRIGMTTSEAVAAMWDAVPMWNGKNPNNGSLTFIRLGRSSGRSPSAEIKNGVVISVKDIFNESE